VRESPFVFVVVVFFFEWLLRWLHRSCERKLPPPQASQRATWTIDVTCNLRHSCVSRRIGTQFISCLLGWLGWLCWLDGWRSSHLRTRHAMTRMCWCGKQQKKFKSAATEWKTSEEETFRRRHCGIDLNLQQHNCGSTHIRYTIAKSNQPPAEALNLGLQQQTDSPHTSSLSFASDMLTTREKHRKKYANKFLMSGAFAREKHSQFEEEATCCCTIFIYDANVT